MNEWGLAPSGYQDIGLRHWWLAEAGKADPIGAKLADHHYSRRTPGSRQFMPPGQTIVLIAHTLDAVFGWWRPDPASGIVAMNGLDGWTCSIFANRGRGLSSDLILDAERAIKALGHRCGPDGMLTYVWGARVQSPNPGFCFLCAGWRKLGWSADRRKRLQGKPFELAGIQACGAGAGR